MKTTQRETSQCFFMAALLVVYEREGQLKQRHLNVMLQTSGVQIMKPQLAEIQTAVIARINTENNVAPSEIKDVVILNIIPLAQCLPSIFEGTAGKAKTLRN